MRQNWFIVTKTWSLRNFFTQIFLKVYEMRIFGDPFLQVQVQVNFLFDANLDTSVWNKGQNSKLRYSLRMLLSSI